MKNRHQESKRRNPRKPTWLANLVDQAIKNSKQMENDPGYRREIQDRAVGNWLHNQVGPAYDALKADPSRAVTADQVRARLAAEHAE